MNIEIFRDYCLAKPGVTEGFPFDETTLVFKVMEKMFTLANLDGDLSVNLKCDPEKAVLTDHSYELVVDSMTKIKKEQLKKLKNIKI